MIKNHPEKMPFVEKSNSNFIRVYFHPQLYFYAMNSGIDHRDTILKDPIHGVIDYNWLGERARPFVFCQRVDRVL